MVEVPMGRSLTSIIRAANEVVLARGELSSIQSFFSPDYTAHLTGGGRQVGRNAVRRFVQAIRRAFADLEIDVEILVSGKGRTAWQRTIRGTHRGNFKGFPPTERRIVWRDMVTSRFQHGLIVEDWLISDLAESLLRSRRR